MLKNWYWKMSWIFIIVILIKSFFIPKLKMIELAKSYRMCEICLYLVIFYIITLMSYFLVLCPSIKHIIKKGKKQVIIISDSDSEWYEEYIAIKIRYFHVKSPNFLLFPSPMSERNGQTAIIRIKLVYKKK